MDKKYLLVTGASSGIGKEIAVQLSEFYNIILCGRNHENLENTKSACQNSDLHLIWEYDLNDIENLESSLSSFLVENCCNVSYFVHSAGYIKTVPLKMTSVDSFKSSFNVNVISAALIMKVLVKNNVNKKVLQAAVFISSNISNFGAKAFSSYSSSKAALDGLMRSLAVELAPVRVNSVLPGGVRTAMTEHMYENIELIERMEKTYPLGLGKTTDISSVVKFLLGDDSCWITGQQIVVDGGRSVNITG